VEGRDLSERFGKSTLGETLLAPTKIYAKAVKAVLAKHPPKSAVKAMANITGGGMVENIPRILPKGLAAEIREGTWTVPAIFPFLQAHGDVPRDEMYRVFNMGVGMAAVTAPAATAGVLRTLAKAGEKAWKVGRVVRGGGEVDILGK
ncbi:MAG TPA: AIR synthase-related protein, partial [Planctomycetota bacterium]|nr:AIR synthase-related protein [Planctomycetota bacterium]